tara:strand:- start:211 stop:396 length:186 start_codon:yes stop_codon:yes gene_type:complete
MGYIFKVQGKDETIKTSTVKKDFSKMSKIELEKFGRTIGIELDRRLSKTTLVKQIEEAVGD